MFLFTNEISNTISRSLISLAGSCFYFVIFLISAGIDVSVKQSFPLDRTVQVALFLGPSIQISMANSSCSLKLSKPFKEEKSFIRASGFSHIGL